MEWYRKTFQHLVKRNGQQMTDKNVEQQPSETALFAALRRTLAYMEYKNEKFGPDSLAIYFLPANFRFFLKFKKIRANTKNKLAGFFPGLNETMIARTAYFDKLFVEALNNKTPQIVLLGAGYDSRAYRFAKLNRGSQVFELDIAPTQNRKKKCLKAARISVPPQVKFVPINFNLESLSGILEKAGYHGDEKTLFIWEGVSYYLDKRSVDATLAFVSHSAKDSLIAFDYTVSITAENKDKYYGTKEFAQTMGEYHANEELTFSLGEGEIVSFLEHRELKLIEHLNAEEIERTYLLDENGSLIGRITGHFRFVIASTMDK
jgi:methyltransferase (TIGR00027 family)